MPPQNVAGWLLLLVWLGTLVLLVRKWRRYNLPLTGNRRWFFLGLVTAQILLSISFGVSLPGNGAMLLPAMAFEPGGVVLLLLAALPWYLAAGFLGPLYAGLLAGLHALIFGMYGTHNPFLLVELSLLGLVLGALLHQRYRTLVYRVLRHPLAVTGLSILIFSLVFTLDATFLATGNVVARLDYAITNLPGILLAVGGSLVIAGLACEALTIFKVKGWGISGPLEVSPAEKSLQARFLYTMLPIGLIIMLLLVVGDWIVSGNAARQMLQGRMSSAVGNAVESVPFFLEAGQDLVQQIADDPRLLTATSAELTDVLRENLRRVPFFSELYLLDADRQLVAAFPEDNYAVANAPLEEQMGVDLALNGVRIQSYAIPPRSGMHAARVSFLAHVMDPSGLVRGVLIGRIDLETNPFTQPILASLDSLTDIDGEGYLLDERGRILYHPAPQMIMSDYPGTAGPEQPFSDQTAPDGTRSLVYYSQAVGRPWSAAVWVPARQSQQLSVEFAAPLLVMILVLSFVTLIIAQIGIRSVTNSLRVLAVEADRIAQGQLDHPLAVEGHDEIGQLRRSFEQMRGSLKARLDELNQLLTVSLGVSSSLDLEESLLPVLNAAVVNNAASAHIVLDPLAFADLSQVPGLVPEHLEVGSDGQSFSVLNPQVLELARQQDRIILTNPARVRVLRFENVYQRPQAMAVFALRHENLYYGVFWLAFDEPHIFTEEETRYYITLASQASLATANANLFLNAEVGRQRLAAILESTPDLVLVTDSQNRLMLANPAARKAFGEEVSLERGQEVKKVIPNERLQVLLENNAADRQSAEVTLPDGRTYLAVASSTMMNGQRSGRVCVMRDITQFKELDALKSEFVSNVSHDLRSPLTLIHGYATMLQMVGELNEQQAGYASKIVSSIEGMSRMVNNLLDLSRIEAGVGLRLEMIPIRDVVEEAIATLQHQAAQKQINLQLAFPENVEPVVEADQALMLQAIQNLVENAIKFTDSGRKVVVGVELQADRVRLFVKDNGIGIAPVDQARLFEKFFRVSRRGAVQPRGTGLGLAIVKSIAERHHGKVAVESQLGKGSTFHFIIPLRQPEQKTSEISQETL